MGSGCLLLFSGTGGCAVSELLGVELHTHHHMERTQRQSKARSVSYFGSVFQVFDIEFHLKDM